MLFQSEKSGSRYNTGERYESNVIRLPYIHIRSNTSYLVGKFALRCKPGATRNDEIVRHYIKVFPSDMSCNSPDLRNSKNSSRGGRSEPWFYQA